jgi:hypothetical protein
MAALSSRRSWVHLGNVARGSIRRLAGPICRLHGPVSFYLEFWNTPEFGVWARQPGWPLGLGAF